MSAFRSDVALTASEGQAAGQLWQAYESGIACDPVVGLIGGDDLGSAYRVQQDLTRRRLDKGGRIVGRKIGLTSPAVQQQLGVDQPDYGALFADMGFGDGEELPSHRLIQPKIEGEIAFVLDRDLTDVGSIAHVIGAIAYAMPAIEVVDSRVRDWKISIHDTIADNASSGLFVVGAGRHSIRDMDFPLLGMVVEHRGEPVSVGCGAACLGNPLNAVFWLARKMVEVGTPLRAGDIILSGALGPMVPVIKGEAYRLRISGLGSVSAFFFGRTVVKTKVAIIVLDMVRSREGASA